jgi:hypothetical protein
VILNALKKAVGLVAGHGTAAAAGLIADALMLAPPGSTGWMIPIDPLLGVAREPAVWARVLAVLRERAL